MSDLTPDQQDAYEQELLKKHWEKGEKKPKKLKSLKKKFATGGPITEPKLKGLEPLPPPLPMPAPKPQQPWGEPHWIGSSVYITDKATGKSVILGTLVSADVSVSFDDYHVPMPGTYPEYSQQGKPSKTYMLKVQQ